MVDMTLIRPLNKGQGHSFWTWYESIPHNSMTIIQLRGIDSYGRTMSSYSLGSGSQ